MQPENPLVGGTVLRRAAIESPNFVLGSAGWIIRQDGSAEFNNVVIRNGQVVSGTALFYSGAPALGTLVASIAAAAGTDSFGNAYLAGFTAYGAIGHTAVQMSSSAVTFNSSPGPGGPWTALGTITDTTWAEPTGSEILLQILPAAAQFALLATILNLTVPLSISTAAAAGKVISAQDLTANPSSPIVQIIAAAATPDFSLGVQVAGDNNQRFRVDSDGSVHWGTGAAATDTALFRGGVGIIQTGQTLAISNQAAPGALAGAAQLYATGGQFAYRNPAGLLANLSGSQLAVITQNTVTQAAFTNLASASIPAGDAEIGAVYKVTAFGSGVWGSTQQQLTFGARFGAAQTTVAGTTPAIAATALAASAAFEWWAEVIAANVTTGAGATWQVLIRGEVTQTLNPILPGTAADNTIGFAGGTTAAAPYTLDSTIAELLGVSAKWAATTGAPTLTKTASFFERIA